MIAFAPPVVFKLPISPHNGQRHQKKRSDCDEERPPSRNVAVYPNRKLRWDIPLRFDAQIITACGYARENRVVGSAAFSPSAVRIRAVVVLDLSAEIIGRAGIVVD